MASPAHVVNTERDTRRVPVVGPDVGDCNGLSAAGRVGSGTRVGLVVSLLRLHPYSRLFLSQNHLPLDFQGLSGLRRLCPDYFGCLGRRVPGLFPGGIASITIILIPPFIIYHTIYLGRFSGLLRATLFAFMYVGLAFLEEETEGRDLFLVSQVALFYFLAEFPTYLANKIILDTGETQGIRLYSFDVAADTATFDGLAANEPALERFVESLRRMRGLSSIWLSRVTGDQGSGGESRRITFTAATRFK